MLVDNTVLLLAYMRYFEVMDIQYDIALAHSPGVGPKRWQRLLDHFGSAKRVTLQQWRELGLPILYATIYARQYQRLYMLP